MLAKKRWNRKVGLYIPGGSAPLFSTILMLAIPAKIAGCDEIVLCTPPNSEGTINPAILAGIANIKIVEKSGAEPPGIYNPTFSIPTLFSPATYSFCGFNSRF